MLLKPSSDTYLDAGDYYLDNLYTIGDGQVLCGQGPRQTTVHVKMDSGLAFLLNGYGSELKNLTISLEGTSAAGVALVDTHECILDNVHIVGGNNATVGLRLAAGQSGSGNEYNCYDNTFHRVHLEGHGVALQLDGVGTAPTVTTNNSFYSLRLKNVLQGIKLASWCDSNDFFNTRIQLRDSNSIGVIFNDTIDPSQDVGVYNDNFFGLAIDAFGEGLQDCVGIWLNKMKQCNVYGYFHSPEVWPGELIKNVYADSFFAVNNQISATDNRIQLISIGVVQ